MGTDADAIAASFVAPESFGEIFDRHGSTVYRYLMRRIGPTDADDLASEVFRIAFERRDTYDLDRPDARPPGLEYDEIAAALSIPVGTVRSRLNRARKKLRELAPPSGELLVHADVFTRQKERLMTTIAGTDAKKLDYVPRMYPRLAYRDEMAALAYLTRVFQFKERRESRLGGTSPDDHMLAWLEFGSGLVMIGHSNEDIHRIVSPLEAGGASVMINVDVDDIDAHYAHAVAEGATITMELEDAFYGSRRYEATDLEGHRWHFDEPHERIRARGGTVPL